CFGLNLFQSSKRLMEEASETLRNLPKHPKFVDLRPEAQNITENLPPILAFAVT
ncbi:40346_t:CDS:1, partial [Gigaspora margarita]